MMFFIVFGIAEVNCVPYDDRLLDYSLCESAFRLEDCLPIQQEEPNLLSIYSERREKNLPFSIRENFDLVTDILKDVCNIYSFKDTQLKKSKFYKNLTSTYPKYISESNAYLECVTGPDTSDNVEQIMSVWYGLSAKERSSLQERLSLCLLISRFCIFTNDWEEKEKEYCDIITIVLMLLHQKMSESCQ